MTPVHSQNETNSHHASCGNNRRSWQEIVEDASRERDPAKLEQLTKELNRALDERDNKLPTLGMPPAKTDAA